MKKVVIIVFAIILLGSFVVADIAYVYRHPSRIDNNVLDVFSDKGFGVEQIQCNDVSSTDFSGYDFIFVGNERLNCADDVPIYDYPSLLMNGRNAKDFGLAGRWGISNIGSSSPLNVFMGGVIQVYDRARHRRSLTMYYIKSIFDNVASAYNGNELGSVVANINPGTVLVNGETANARISFFGAVKTDFWTNDMENLFKDEIDFVNSGEAPGPPEPECGNGELEEGEECDDGNLENGDGCSDVCEIEEEPPEGVHDVMIDLSYSNTVNGIRIKDKNTSEYLLDDPAQLICGKQYEIKFRTKNVGNFTEDIDFLGMIADFNWTSSKLGLEPGSTTYAGSKTIDDELLEIGAGAYTVDVLAEIVQDDNPADNSRSRDVEIVC